MAKDGKSRLCRPDNVAKPPEKGQIRAGAKNTSPLGSGHLRIISNRHYLPIRNALKSFPLFADTRSNRQWISALPISARVNLLAPASGFSAPSASRRPRSRVKLTRANIPPASADLPLIKIKNFQAQEKFPLA